MSSKEMLSPNDILGAAQHLRAQVGFFFNDKVI